MRVTRKERIALIRDQFLSIYESHDGRAMRDVPREELIEALAKVIRLFTKVIKLLDSDMTVEHVIEKMAEQVVTLLDAKDKKTKTKKKSHLKLVKE